MTTVPRCRECGKTIHPTDHIEVKLDNNFDGKYCSSDCAIDAYERGYPARLDLLKVKKKNEST